MRQLVGPEEATEGRKCERVFTGRECTEDHLHALVAVIVAVPRRTAHAVRPEHRKTIAVDIERSSIPLGVGGMGEDSGPRPPSRR